MRGHGARRRRRSCARLRAASVRGLRRHRSRRAASRSGGRRARCCPRSTRATMQAERAFESRVHARQIADAAIRRSSPTSCTSTCCSRRSSAARARPTSARAARERPTRTAAGAGARRAGDAGASRGAGRRARRCSNATNAIRRRRRRTAVACSPSPPVAHVAAAGLVPPGRARARAGARQLSVRARRGDSGRRRPVACRARRRFPTGFVYVPAGEFWFGDADEQLRTQFLDTVPIHRRADGGVPHRAARDHLSRVDRIPGTRCRRQSARARARSRAVRRAARCACGRRRRLAADLPADDAALHRRAGEPFVYAGRTQRARQDWLRFPVAGISPADVERYLPGCGETGRVPGARLCTEVEWERAARGADDRLFPHGDELAADDANFDLTYGRVDSAYGPDAVSARTPPRAARSASTTWRATCSSSSTRRRSATRCVIRGGAYSSTRRPAAARTASRCRRRFAT